MDPEPGIDLAIGVLDDKVMPEDRRDDGEVDPARAPRQRGGDRLKPGTAGIPQLSNRALNAVGLRQDEGRGPVRSLGRAARIRWDQSVRADHLAIHLIGLIGRRRGVQRRGRIDIEDGQIGARGDVAKAAIARIAARTVARRSIVAEAPRVDQAPVVGRVPVGRRVAGGTEQENRDERGFEDSRGVHARKIGISRR